MVTIETSRLLGGVGALLIFVGVFPYINFLGIVDIIGVILVLFALYNFANYYRESGIFNYALYGVIAGIIGVVAAAVVGIAIALPNLTGFIQKAYPGWDGQLSSIPSLSSMTPVTTNLDFSDVVPFIVAGISVIVILWIFAIVMAFFVRRSLLQVSSKTSVGLFSTAGLLLLVGAALTIILVGAFLIWIAVLLLAVAFLTMKTQPQHVAT
jgi:uncharacterized membrane protein